MGNLDERLRAALQASVIALDDWLHEYAPEWCGEPYVTETRERIAKRGGTLAYIAKVQQENRAALAALPEASPRTEHNWAFEMAQQRVEIVERMMKLPYIKAQRDTEKGQERFVCRDDVITMIHNYAKELRAAVPEASPRPVSCLDCGMDYTKKQPLDVTLSKEQWLLLNPDDGGILCAGCIVKRAAQLPQIITVAARLVFATDYDKFNGPLRPEQFVPDTIIQSLRTDDTNNPIVPEASEPPLEKYFRDRFNTEWTPELEQELLEKIAAKQKAAPLAQQHTHTPEDTVRACCSCGGWSCSQGNITHKLSAVREACARQHAEHVWEVAEMRIPAKVVKDMERRKKAFITDGRSRKFIEECVADGQREVTKDPPTFQEICDSAPPPVRKTIENPECIHGIIQYSVICLKCNPEPEHVKQATPQDCDTYSHPRHPHQATADCTPAAPLAQQHTHTPAANHGCCSCGGWKCDVDVTKFKMAGIWAECRRQHAEHVREVSR